MNWEIFDKYPQEHLECWCGARFHSHVKFLDELGLISRVPCPQCGKDYNIKKVHGKTETWEVYTK